MLSFGCLRNFGNRMLGGPVCLGLVLGATGTAVAADSLVISEAGTRQEIDVTVYNQNLALVREVRYAALPEGEFSLEFRDVPAQIEPRSLLVEASGGSGFRLLEQNYEFDLMSKEKILEKYVGQEISWVQEDGERITGRLLGMTAGPVFEVDGEVVFEVPGRIALPTLPENLRARPTLVWRAETRKAGESEIQTSYLTRGMSWSADYVLQLDPAGEQADLQAWVTMDNRSGATFRNARLLLVAGDIHQAPPPTPAMRHMATAVVESPAYGKGVREEALYDYHLYTLPGQSTLKDAQMKQISLFEASGIGVVRHYRLLSMPSYYRGGGEKTSKEKIRIYYAFENEQANNLGLPLPAGVFRVYGESASGTRQLLGEDRIQHTPKDEEVELLIGTAFDLTAERVRTNYRRVADGVHETTFEITLRNHKDEDVVVEVREAVGGDWRILDESHEHKKLSSTLIEYALPVKADGETVLNYTVQVRY